MPIDHRTVLVESLGSRLDRLVRRARQAQVDAEKEQGRSQQLEAMLNASRPASAAKPFPIPLESDVPLT